MAGIIDFGGLIFAHRIHDLAVFLANTVDFDHPLEHLAHLTRAYSAVQPLTPQEKQVLLPLVRTRMAFIVLLQCLLGNDASYYTQALHPLQQHSPLQLIQLLESQP